jgi:hypothetical protein
MLCTMRATDRKILEAMIEQMNASTARADAALDRALASIAESDSRACKSCCNGQAFS